MSTSPTAVRIIAAKTNAICRAVARCSKTACAIPLPQLNNYRPGLALPAALARVRSRVRVLDERLGAAPVERIRGDAPASCGHPDGPSSGQLHVSVVEHLHESNDDLLRFLAGGVGHDDRELVAAVTRGHVFGPDLLADRLGERPQHLVSR